MNSMLIRARYNYIQLISCKKIEGKARFLFSLPFPPSSNGMKWHAMILILIAIPADQWYARICFAFTYIAIPADAMTCKDMFCIHIHCHSCWCKPFAWIRIEWIRIAWIRIGGIRVERIRIGGIRIDGIRLEWICVGYVWCDGYVWDMCGVRYANNLLKNPATKRLSGKNWPKKNGGFTGVKFDPSSRSYCWWKKSCTSW